MVTPHTHPCGHVSLLGRCELEDPINRLPSLWGVAEVVPARPGLPEHLHPFQYCDTEATAVERWSHHSSSTIATHRPPVIVIRRDRPGARWEATL